VLSVICRFLDADTSSVNFVLSYSSPTNCSVQRSCMMENLPDELLLKILGYVNDGLTLLDSVPLVCKHWYRLSQDPRVWSSVELNVALDDNTIKLNDARVLQHAPAIKKLWIFTMHNHGCVVSFTLALNRCRALVYHLSLHSVDTEEQSVATAVFNVLRRNQSHLRVLSTSLFHLGQSCANGKLEMRVMEELTLDDLQQAENYKGK
jgi:hypothetical protein